MSGAITGTASFNVLTFAFDAGGVAGALVCAPPTCVSLLPILEDCVFKFCSSVIVVIMPSWSLIIFETSVIILLISNEPGSVSTSISIKSNNNIINLATHIQSVTILAKYIIYLYNTIFSKYFIKYNTCKS